MPCFSVSMGASLPRTFHLTFGAAILLHGQISKIRARHGPRNDAGYNYGRNQWVPIGDARPAASVPQKGPCITRPGPVDASLKTRTPSWISSLGLRRSRLYRTLAVLQSTQCTHLDAVEDLEQVPGANLIYQGPRVSGCTRAFGNFGPNPVCQKNYRRTHAQHRRAASPPSACCPAAAVG